MTTGGAAIPRLDSEERVLRTSKRPETTAEHIAYLQEHSKLMRSKPRTGVDYVVFGVAGVIAIAFVAWGLISPDGLGAVASSLLSRTMENFGWLFVVAG